MNFFYTTTSKGGKLIKQPLGGIPAYSVFNITGVSDTGKSLMVEQFTVQQAKKGNKVAFITVEAPANFLVAGLKLRAQAMGYDFEKFEDNIILIDAASYGSLRDNIPELLSTLAYVIQNYKVKFTVIDSVTGLFENREMLARVVVRQIFNFLKKMVSNSFTCITKKEVGMKSLQQKLLVDMQLDTLLMEQLY